MAPDISLDLINSQAMADALRDLDPTISERAMIARLIRQIDLLALIKLDNNARQIQVHRVVQAVVNAADDGAKTRRRRGASYISSWSRSARKATSMTRRRGRVTG